MVPVSLNKAEISFKCCMIPNMILCLNGYKTGPGGYKTFFMLNLDEHVIYSAHKCENVNNQHL